MALRRHLDGTPTTAQPPALRAVLTALGERGRARGAARVRWKPAATTTASAAKRSRLLAELDEAEGAVLAAAERWEQILADDIDDPQARAHLAAAAADPLRRRRSTPSQTLVSPEGVETLRYRLLRELGAAPPRPSTWRATRRSHLDVALKVLHPQLPGPGRSEALRRFFADARLAAAVRHPGVVAIYDVDEAARALAMEWIAGRHAARAPARARRAAADREMQRDRAQPARRARPSVHARGIVHGDLKPSNLLLRAPGRRGARRLRRRPS